MYFHLTYLKGALCESEDLGITTENINITDCPECVKIIREAALKLHKRRKKDLDRVIIQKVLIDNHTRENTSVEDLESYWVRLRELDEEVSQFNPDNPKESYVMSLITQECEVING